MDIQKNLKSFAILRIYLDLGNYSVFKPCAVIVSSMSSSNSNKNILKLKLETKENLVKWNSETCLLYSSVHSSVSRKSKEGLGCWNTMTIFHPENSIILIKTFRKRCQRVQILLERRFC